jgi:hypothetical protein
VQQALLLRNQGVRQDALVAASARLRWTPSA